MSVLPLDPRLDGISPKSYEHPADRAATAALKSVPMLDTVVRKLTEFRYERSLRQLYLGNAVQVGPDQLGGTWAAYKRALHVLDIDEEYPLYLAHGVGGNAVTIGTGKPMIVVESSLHALLDPDEQRAVLAHELGHVLSDHVLYATALQIIVQAARASVPFPFALPLRAIRTVLLEWFRAAELTCDRAAVLAVRDPRIVCRTLMVVAGGRPSSELSLDAFLAQAMEYESWEDPHDRVRRFLVEVGVDHAFAVRRVSEVMRWVRSGEYDRIMAGEYRRRDEPPDPRGEASDAVDFYSERFKAAFRDAGDAVEKLGSQVSDFLRKS